MDFEKVKELLKEAIDEGNTIAEIMQITADKIYQQGVKDGEQDDGCIMDHSNLRDHQSITEYGADHGNKT